MIFVLIPTRLEIYYEFEFMPGGFNLMKYLRFKFKLKAN